MIEIREFHPADEKFQRILKRAETSDGEIRQSVEDIIAAVRERGDAALCEFSERFDGVKLTPADFRVRPEEFAAARKEVTDEFLGAVALARHNIRRFHQYQRRQGYVHDDGDGVCLAQRVTPLARVGVCVPAKSAPLFSTVLMSVIPAQIAAVDHIYAVVPPRADGSIDPHILAVIGLVGIDAVFRLGGAHAVAALAHGTETVPRVDKIVGPGNAYVTMAKRLVFGCCGIDAIAGPSEIVIIADSLAKPRYVAADLLSQLEHGSGLEAGVVLTDSRDLAAGVKIEIQRQLPPLSRRARIEKALRRYSAIFICRDLFEAVDAANQIAPEHLEIATVDAELLLREVENAGAVFLGPFATEAVGDYFAGTNHVLPTGGAARFASSLSVHDFLKSTTVIRYTAKRLRKTGRHIITLAETEGLDAHANAVKVRLEDLAGE